MEKYYTIFENHIYYLDEQFKVLGLEYFEGFFRNNLPEKKFIKPILNNGFFLESTSEEEILEFNKPKVPVKVKKADFKLALIKAGISTSDVTNFIYNIPESLDKDKIIILWEDTEEFFRDDKVLNDMAPLFNITQEQLDQIFLLTLKN